MSAPVFDRAHPGFVPWNPGRKDSPGWIVSEGGCHIWVGWKVNGYARVTVGGRGYLVHRLRYEREIGPIPDGTELDHYVCSNGPHGCCNPHHCRPATHRENSLRADYWASDNAAKTHCDRGHPLSGDNLFPGDAKRQRRCRTCHNARERARGRKRRRGVR